MNTRFIFGVCVVNVMLAVGSSSHADENIVEVSKLNMDPRCSDKCRMETPSCTRKEDYADSDEEDKISEICMKDATPCYLRCTHTESDKSHKINIMKVSELTMDTACVNRCRSKLPKICTTEGDYISEECYLHPKMTDCYSVCMGAVEPEA
ncbi:hypothetical protein CAPTEDRAFT_196906 [Capitella teleta]|uniref:Uncharacterized protein n=1 Tax=Capitella teleta TaxID=283909 RepID=R7VE42_CAPTE|nr:hypothetical protein CAPTEDRAFT_196906 [Capitella teleta]|eukprot:ELU16832.1 hypothetical protein CAPTEDRAFT_196906 [Capitella teleta]